MTKEEILNYVMDTPENTNRMVLNDMLNEFNSGGGGIQTIKPVIGEFVQDVYNKGHCSFTVTGLKYDSLYLLDFEFERDVAPLIPGDDWYMDSNESRVFFYHKTPVWYTWNSDYAALMVSLINSEERASNDRISPEEGETFTANIVFYRDA